MNRRELLSAGLSTAALLASPSVLRAREGNTLKFVPIADLAIVDPIVTSSLSTRCHAYLVFDTLYGLDKNYQATPQMLDGHVVEEDGKSWTLTLREGLSFHDGEKVLARDAVASLERWGKRDAYGGALFKAVDEISVLDDRKLRFRLKRAFPRLPDALAKTGPNMSAIMPERLALTEANLPVKEVVGSGPFRFVASEREPGARIVYERHAPYVPRASGEIGFSSGPKLAKVERVEWTIVPDPATAVAALQRGEVDWIEAPIPDLMPVLARDPNVAIKVADQVGIMPVLRFNCLNPPFDDARLRRIVLEAVDQREVLAAYASDETILRAGVGVFPFGTPMENRAGMARLFGRTDIEAARRALAEAGYSGEKVLLMAGADNPVTSAAGQVVADLLERIGFNVDFPTLDSATLIQRRTSRERVDKGGWSLFIVGYAGFDTSPAESFLIRGNGKDAWFGWPTSPELERLRDAWIDAPDVLAQKQLAEDIQRQVWRDAPFVPLGQIVQKTAFRRSITGVLDGFAKFYNVDKS
ncbi:MAG: ABC transporter substrate-binding protein [Hyphomicrobiales bacterium]|nr:ABC transporter substrate-binding protein [Hyphomicrobiales bacterium]